MGSARILNLTRTDYSAMEESIVGVLYLVIGVMGVVGNFATLLTFVKGKAVQSPKHVLHSHFALANIGIIICFALPGISLINGRWMFGDFGCQTYAFESFFCGLSAIGFLVALTFERYLANCWSDFYATLKTGHMHFLALLVWAQGFFWATMPVLGWSRYSYEPRHMTCTIDWTASDASHVSYITSLTIFCFVIPFVLITFFMSLARMMLGETKQTSPAGMMTETQLMKIVTFMMIMSLLMWSPLAINCTYSVMMGGDPTPSLLRITLPALSAKAGTAMLPLVYPSISPEYRTVFGGLFSSEKKKQ